MNISSIPEDMSVQSGNGGASSSGSHNFFNFGNSGNNSNNSNNNSSNRSRAYSHTRTNSSSSSASSHVQSPPNANQSNLQKPNAPFGASPPGYGGGDTSDGSTSSSYAYNTASEAAAVAAIRSNVNNVQISSTNRPPVEDGNGGYQQQLGQAITTNSYYSTPQTATHLPPSASSSSLYYSEGGGSNQQQQYSTTNNSNKLSNVAVSAAAFAAKPKERALSKAKMFARQAKPHLSSSSSNPSLSQSKRKNVDLTIQTKQLPPTARPSFSERSPLSRPSKELDRIASFGPSTPGTRDIDGSVAGGGSGGGSGGSGAGGNSGGGKQHKHHMPFRSRKDSHPGVVLSSSSSNSKLISEQGSIYSFHPSSPGASALEVKNLGNKAEDRDQIAEDSWTLLCSKVMPLFSGEGLRVPVEDLNNLVVMHLDLLIRQGVGPKEVISEFRNLLKIGIINLDSTLSRAPDEKLISRLVEVWMSFFSQALPYLEAVFLPLQLEFEGVGQILSQEEAQEYWLGLLEKPANLTTHRYILMAFRDHVVLPISDRLLDLTARIHLDFGETEYSGIAARILQCTNILSAIQSNDENQAKIDGLVKALKSSWLTMPRTAKDRRGFILNKSVNSSKRTSAIKQQ